MEKYCGIGDRSLSFPLFLLFIDALIAPASLQKIGQRVRREKSLTNNLLWGVTTI
jgi:hypothetical protein